MKKIILLLSAIILLTSFTTESVAQRKKSYSNFKIKSYSNTYKIPKSNYSNTFKPKSYKSNYKKPDYTVGSTKYKFGETYKSTGLPRVKRSSSSKNDFLKNKGYKKVPEGYEVDHIIPLSKGGQDTPSNMQLLPKELHKQKTANERKR